jgi:hypothetical protein
VTNEMPEQVMPDADGTVEPGMIGDPDLGLPGDAEPRPEIEDGEPVQVNDDEDDD